MHSQLPSQELKQSFFEYNRDYRIANSKVGCMLVVVLMPAGFLLDYFVYPQNVKFFFLLRIICSLLAFALWGLLSTSLGRRHFRALGMLWFILPSLFISIMIYFADGVNSSYYAGLNLVLIAISWVAQVDFLETIVASSLTLFMYCAACFAHGPVTSSVLFNNLYFIVLTGIIVVTGSYYVSRLRFREFALRAEVDRNRKDLEASNLKLIEVDRAKSDFFANISHELRTPLTLLIGPLEKLRTNTSSAKIEKQGELLDIMYGNAMRLLRLINDLLNLVRLDAGTLVLRKEKVEIKPFLEGLALSVSPMAQQSRLKFETQILAGEHEEVYLDRDKFEKMLFNLLFNAFKFTPQGGEVHLWAKVENQRLDLSVRDSGVGISKEDIGKVFKRFWQAEGSTTRRYQGVGIGLALVKELAGIHGGEVSAESELGIGTTMKFHVDVSPPPVIELSDQPVAESPPNREEADWLNRLYRRAELFPAHVLGATDSDSTETDKSSLLPHVLLVDDEPDMRRFLNSQLEDRYSISEASSGAVALELAKENHFSLILLDFMMPEMDGIEVMKRLKKDPGTRSTPVIMLTARADEDFKLKALEAGATDFLTKPFSSTELSVRAHNIISAYELQKQLMEKTEQLETALEQIKQTETQLVHHAKMASLGQLSAGLMHEINNPMNFANTALHILKKRLASSPAAGLETLAKPLTDVQDGIQRVVGIITSLRSFTHPDNSTFERVKMAEVTTTATRFVQVNSQEISLKIDMGESIELWGNKNQLIHLFINFLQNAIDSLQEKGAQTKEIQINGQVRGEEIEITFYDNGKGIAEENLSRIFDAFFTTKKVGAGVGLGLNICHRIIEQHKGKIQIDSKKNEFCRFILTFPKYKS
jgi:signal transduction histidine kinase